MPVRTAEAHWEGSLQEGQGSVKLGSGVFEGAYSFGTRFQDEMGTNPEELIGAAHAGCFSMAFSAMLGEQDYKPSMIETSAEVAIEKEGDGFAIPRIKLTMKAEVPGIDQDTFQSIAQQAKEGCPVSKALAGTDIELDAQLL
jgi:osmotically inducible protein OsmC